MLNILGEADGEEGMARAHEVMARAYAVRAPPRPRPAVRLRPSPCPLFSLCMYTDKHGCCLVRSCVQLMSSASTAAC